MKYWMVVAVAGIMGWMGTSTGRGETTVTLPVGAGEHFTVEDADSNALLRVENEAILIGSGIPIEAQSGNLSFVISNEVQMTLGSYFGMANLIVGSNTYSSIWGCELFGYENTMQSAANAAILGGRDNNLSAGSCRGFYSMPYFSVIAGGQHNGITGSQSSAISGGGYNSITNAGTGAVIIGGFNNKVTESYGTVLGGQYNHVSGTNALAAGYHARALHNGSFVWADYSSATNVASSNDNEVVIRAVGGVRLDAQLGTNALPNRRARYADNNIVAWARIDKNTGLTIDHFGVHSLSNTAQGTYLISLDARMTSGYSLIPIAVPEVDSALLPTNAAQARNIYVDQINFSTNFYVYITDGNHSLTNNDFLFMVTGR
ncbi:MAG: hypothetical protein PHG65_12805 [Kiritimatiellae bacterium]|nr:hypothetical protein [Kiritimatiellia bacterium]